MRCTNAQQRRGKMKKHDKAAERRITLGQVSRSTQGGVRGTIEPFGLYQAGIQLS